MTDHGSILFVEDDRDIRESIVEALEDEGYTVVGAVDGMDGIARLREIDPLPELILLDLMMPRMNGIEFCGEVAKVPAWSPIPIVVLSADAQGRSKAESLGVFGFLKKPVKLAQLFAVVARAVQADRSKSP